LEMCVCVCVCVCCRKQTSNPFTQTQAGYEAIDVPFTMNAFGGGLGVSSSTTQTWLDATFNDGLSTPFVCMRVHVSPVVEMCVADAGGERRFAPYLEIYLGENPLNASKKAEWFEKLKDAGVDVFEK